LPGVILGPLASPFVDRFPKKPLLLFTDVLRAIFALGYGLAIVFQASWLLYVSALFLGISGILFEPSRNATLPLVVSRKELTEAYALEAATTGVLQIIGAVCGGIVVVAVSPLWCFGINAASYLWSAFSILRTRWQEVPEEPQQRTSYLQSLKAGFREAGSNRVARAIIFIGISWGLAGGGYYVLIPLLGVRALQLDGLGIGLLYATDGLGVLIGSYLVRRLVNKDHRRAVVWYGFAYITQAIFFAALAQSPFFLLSLLMLLLMRISSGVIIPLDSYLLQSSAGPGLQGRLFALHSSTYGGMMQLSYVLTGLAYERVGIPLVGLVIGGMSLVCGLSWLLQFFALPAIKRSAK
jgi:MFS family permease